MRGLIACDIDDTLVLPGHEPTAATWKALRTTITAAAAHGYGFTFASGRTPARIAPLLAKLQLSPRAYVACNGALVKQGPQTLCQQTFSVRRLAPVLAAALALDFTVLYTRDEQEYLVADNPDTLEKRMQRGHYHPLRSLAGNESVMKVNILARPQLPITKLAAVLNPLAAQLNLTYYGDRGVEIVAASATKKNGLEPILAQLGLSFAQVLAVGDNHNDRELFQAAGRGLAVQNATAEIKALASYVSPQPAINGVISGLRHELELN